MGTPHRPIYLAIEAMMISTGMLHATMAISRLARATLGQCEAVDLVPTADDANYIRCTNTGVRIRETWSIDHTRHRTVCPKHGYDPKHTPPLTPEEL